MLEAATESRTETGIEHLLKNFEVYYQPICHPTNLSMEKMEALARFPGMDAEETITGLEENIFYLKKFTLKVIEKVMTFIETTKTDHGIDLPPIAINLPPQLIPYWTTLPEDIRASLQAHHVEGVQIQIEITERGILSIQKEEIAELQQKLNEMAIATNYDDVGDSKPMSELLAVNDEVEIILGTTFSGIKTSVGHLLKKDITGMDQIMEKIRKYNSWVVVEKVETQEQLQGVLKKLAEYGIAEAKIGIQGYLFFKPMKADAVVTELQKNKGYRLAT